MKRERQINAAVNFETGRGFGRMGEGLPAEIFRGDPAKVLTTIAALFLNPVPERNNKFSLAVANLALYAARAQVTLTTRQFRQLERTVKEYRKLLDCPQYFGTLNAGFATYVLKHARRRAKQQKVI